MNDNYVNFLEDILKETNNALNKVIDQNRELRNINETFKQHIAVLESRIRLLKEEKDDH